MAEKEEENANTEDVSPDLAVDPPLVTEETDKSSSTPVKSLVPRLVVNGLKLKQKSQKLPFRAFDYTPAIVYSADLGPTDWHLLSAYDIVGDHIRIHELKEEDNLLECAREYQESHHAQAMIVVNTTEDSTLSPECSQSLQKLDSFLVAVLPRTEGIALLDCLQVQFEDDELFARLDVVGSEATPFTVLGEDDDTAVYEGTEGMEMNTHSVSTQAKGESKGFNFKFFSGRSNIFDLKTEIKKLMFDGDNMLPVSTNAGLFTIIMSNFSQYERMGKHEPSQVNELIKKFNLYLEPSFHHEFPFFLVLVYRLRKFRKIYECEELGQFITRCIEMFEILTPTHVADSLKLFLEKKDFDIMFGQEEANTSVFTLLATACRDLMNVSTQIKSSRPNNIGSKRMLYCKLLWISVYMKCLGEKGTVTRHELAIWDNSLLKTSGKIQIKKEIIEDLRLGLEVSAMLNLPPDHQFTIHHLAQFLANDKLIRPLSHIRDAITGLENFIKTDRELLVHVMINLRAHYTSFLQASTTAFVKLASIGQTVLGALDEGISFLDSMTQLWNKKKWNKGEQHKDFRAECLKWMMLLHGTVRMTDPNSPQLLKKFLAPKRGSVIADRDFRSQIVHVILEETRKSFPQLTIQLFFPLYKAYRIWPIPFLHDFLKQYHIPNSIKISDATWSEFFSVVLGRFQSDEPQMHLLEFLIRVADVYRKDKRPGDFIPDVIQLKVPQLFSADTETGLNGESIVGERFSDFLKAYIQRNNLRPKIMSRIQEIIGYIPENEQTAFHWIVLNVLQSEVIPELKSLQEDDKQSTKQFKDLLKLSVNTLCQRISWFGPLSPRQKFCWGVVAAGCSKIPFTAESFEWVFNLQVIITQLGIVFNAYCNSRKLFGQACLLTDIMPQEVRDCPWEDVQSYFNWVRKLQDLLCLWQNKFLRNDLNYDEILMYANNNVAINTLGRAVCAATYVMDMQDVSEVKKTFTLCFDLLNCYLLRYVPDHPEVKYCTLPELLLHYGVSFPLELQGTLQQKIIFPGNERKIPEEQQLRNIISPFADNDFNPGQDVSLMVTKAFTLYDLQKLLGDLQTFLEPIIDHIEMFVFFHLHKSEMFIEHLFKCLNDITVASSPNKPERSFLNLPSSIRPSLVFTKSGIRQAKDEGIPIKVLQRALDRVKDLLLKIVKGTATYSDIVADGALKLETLKTEEEFAILTKFSDSLEMNRDNCEGLDGVKSMLDLFQFIYHIGRIKQVCEQYGLEQCLKDDNLQKMLVIAEELKVEQSRAQLTPIEAKAKMAFIKEALCLGQRNNYKCLDLFPIVAKSAAFYQFIRDKQFVGSKGQAIFREQYQLITAQLQHEEYDENVLNHLRVAYEFIVPFMETNVSFRGLMSKVTKLDATHGLKQLETVNENITLIRLWFSRAEGDTIENVAKELQHILSTGIYQFQLSGDSSILLIYQTMQNMRPQRKINGAPLEDSGETPKGMPTYHAVYPSPLPTTFKKDEGPFSNTMGSVEQRWTSEQIADFVRKLGFLDTKKEGGDMISQFLHLNSTANKLLELFMKLFELGHPHYQKYRNLPILLCNTPTLEADAMVDEIQKTLLEWRNQVDALRQKYTWLLFFSVPKALHLYSLLEEDLEPDLDSIVLEVSFLFENNKIVRNKLKSVIKDALEETQEKVAGATPMEFLGEFLQLVCGSQELEFFLCKERSTRRTSSASRLTTQLSITSPTASGVPLGSYQLHYTPGYSQSQIICLITDLYKGVPECFEVFHCRPSTTQEELHLFMERIKHHSLPYLVLEVNKLPFSLQELLMTLLKQGKTAESHQNGSSVHFIETSPSVLREVPWITYREYKDSGPNVSIEEAGRLCRRLVVHSTDFSCIQLVYGHAGDGKTHYIRQQLAKSPARLTVAVNEAFTPLYAISSLNKLPQNVVGCAVFFNFTLMPYQKLQDETEKKKANELIETVGWFFYHFLVLGYVEDPTTGASFRFPGGQEWAVYIEVPSLDRNHRPEEILQLFTMIFPTLGLLGSTHPVYSVTPITVDEDVQLVCKYLRAYKTSGVKGIDRLYKEGPLPGYAHAPPNANKKVKFSEDPDLSDGECHHLLMEYMPDHIQETKITQKLFIRYMKRRCAFLDNLPAFNYNTGAGEILFDETSRRKVKTDTRQLGSTLMQTMLEEVGNFCDPDIKRNWAERSHQQLIYDFRDGGGSFGLLSLQLENMPEARLKEYKKIGFELHPSSKLQRREILDQMLARALGLPSEAGKRLSVIDDCNYVLTLDYTIKMLNIHERYSCGVPVIIKGETGVGKTALVDMLSRLWSNALLHLWDKERGTIIDAIRDLMSVRIEDSLENYQTCLEIVEAITEGRDVSVHDLMILGQLNDRDPSKGQFYSRLRELLLEMEGNPAIALMKVPSAVKGKDSSLAAMFQLSRKDSSAEATATLLQAVLKAKIRNTFHKLNVHAALTPCDIKTFFEPVFEQANLLKEAYQNADESKKTKIKMPFITVFLDEVNTSSCLGLFKEIIVDKTLDGTPIPENVFIVAACNPHRGNSMATHAAETWLRSSYYVRPLHPTLEYLIWDYGSLDQYQERDYIRTKMQMLHKELPNIEVVTLTDLIVESQSLMRRYALRQLTNQKMKPEEAEVSSKSCVSQRDIQRVFTFYQWLMSVYGKLKQHGEDRVDYSRRAVMVSLGIVYYMRLNSQYRKEYEQVLNRKVSLPGEVQFSDAFNEELNFFCKSIELPPGIAKTRALKENLFATIVCTVTHTPLVIVGAPGSSKTLSFNLAIANLKGHESKMALFRDIDIFKSLDPHFYQCSRRTTSIEVQTVFSRAINRQRSHAKFSLPIYCVVFMDEAGLPEESHESLKVLHYHLDKQEVSFVAITNHVLDAAKTNRAVSLFRPEVSKKDLETLAKGCLTPNPENPPAHLKKDLETIVRFCPAYSWLMEDPVLRRFFGLRDFIHFINYLRRRRGGGITPQLVMEALERNFNGVYWSNKHGISQAICESFLKTMAPPAEKKPMAVRWRSILEVLKESLGDHPEGNRDENEVRYKLVIDPTEDNSLMHLLIAFGVLDRKNTRIYVCSDFPGDNQIQKINTIAAIRHSAIEGHTVVMSQTDDIHESFYDLFNQRFRRIDDPEHGPRYYANIAIGAHLRPCRVHPDFQCVVVVKQTEVDSTPAPFLNRFEKYCISHETLLSTALNHLQPCVKIILQTAREKVNEFIDVVGRDNINVYGLKPQTVDSLILSLLPPYGHTYKETTPGEPISDDVRICLLHELLRALRSSAGFAVPAYPIDELVMDANHLFPLLDNDATFEGAFNSLTIETANTAVNEAMHILHTAPNPNEEGVVPQEISQEACLVVSILQQWLIRHFCKTLMQLMTPEAICLHRRKIPASLIDNYLTNQQHFSLKELIGHHLLALESRQSNTYLCPNKLLCFTRSSSIIHHLPTTYPRPVALKGSMPDDEDTARLKELIHDDPAHIQVCQVVSVQSQTAIQETLRDFIQEPARKILLLMVNMQEATIEMANHLRVMIEEAEAQAPPTTDKLFVLLLHFPPNMFFDPCYPSLFLRGWNHYYLDSIGHSPSLHSGKLDIEEWLQRCCFSNKEFDGDNILEACNHLLTEVVPALVSHITYGTRSTGPFTRNMKAAERSEKLKELLFGKRVGQKLCQMFRTCWRPNMMIEYLEIAARFTRSRESSLNITDAVQSMFQSLFTNFMIVMVTRINTKRNLDVLFSEDNCSEVEEIFLSLLETIKPPKLDQLKTLAGSLAQPQPQDYQPSFPFFSIVNKSMEQLIEDSRKIKGNQDNLLEDHPEEETPTASHSGGMDSGIADLAELMFTTIDERLQEEDVTSSDPLFITLKYIKAHPEKLWDRYFCDFIYHSLHMDIVTSTLSREVISAFFSDLLELSPIQRLVYLHIYVDYNRINLANVCSLLRPLEKIWEVAAGSPHSLTTGGSSPANDFIKVVRETKHPFGDPQMMSSFVISALFSALVGAIIPQSKTEDQGMKNAVLRMWYRTYQRVMSMPALRSHLYITPLPENEEAKFNAIHTTFTLMCIYPKVDEEDVLIKGHNLFSILLQKYFKTNLQLKDPGVVPSLADCSKIAGELIFDDGNTSIARGFARTLQEELFNHFLSPYRASYSSQDRDWFLRQANSNYAWKASTQLVNETVISSSYSEDLLGAVEKSLNRLVPLNKKLNSVTMANYKRYLSLLLGSSSVQTEDQPKSDSGPLMMYDAEARKNVATVLSDLENGEEPGPYIPTFYQDCRSIRPTKNSENLIMQQPLCHLYFSILMEHLVTEPRDINSLVRLAGTISQLSRPQSVPLGEKIVLQIEKQAVIQCLLRGLASLFSNNTNRVLVTKELAPIMDELNDLLNDDSTGGGAVGGHRLTLGMHLLHKLRSHRRFTELFTTRYPIIKEVQCTSVFHEQLRAQVESKPHLFPFMCLEDQVSPLSKLYQQVKSAMLNIDASKGSQASIDQLVKVADECAHWKNKPHDRLDRRQAFKMILWLVTYYEFFVKKKSSQALSLAIGQQLKHYIKDEGVVRLVQSFLRTKWLIEKKESPMPLREDAQMIKILSDGRAVRVDHGGEKADPLYNLFVPDRLSPRDQSDDELCHCMANLVGVVLGCQPQSNHLWYHLFAPDELKDTYMTGFMYDAKISPEGLLYDCGVELTPDGQYGRPDYLPHATRGTYSLHSLYFLLWANFGTFCVSMLTQPHSQSKIHGSIISDWQAIRHYCVSQVRTLWMNLRNNLSLSDEERSFLVTRCLMTLYETNMESTGITLGKLKTKEELNDYEAFWHEKVFTPAWQELHSKFEDYSVLWQNQLFINIRQLEACYPQYPSEKDFLNYIQGLKVDDGGWRLLARFAVEKQRLEVGGQLLPGLIQLYQWLHTYLAHLVTPERAYNKLMIGRVIQLASKRVDPSLRELYQNVKGLYNKYVELVGGAIGQGACAAVRRGNRIYTIEDDLPLIHFLSDSKEEGEGNDWLYAVIQDIADSQNHFIHTLYANMGNVESGEHPLARLLPQDPSTIYLAEANEHSCIVGKQKMHRGLSEFLWLVRARLDPPVAYRVAGSPTDAQAKAMSLTLNKMMPRPSLSFNLTHFQEDVVSHYLSGKPLIQDISGMRAVFKFKQEKKSTDTKGLDSDPMGASADITVLGNALPPDYRIPLEANHSRHLEYEFHSATYHILTDIVIGLRTAVGLLVKVLTQDNSISVQSLDKLSLHEFMLSQYGTEESSKYQVLNQIGIRNVSDTQLRWLSSTKLSLLFSTLELFVGWVKEGLYDFSSLPMALKVQLSENDLTTLGKIPAKYPGTSSNLLAELKGLVEVLLHTEHHIIKEVNQIAQKPIVEVLDTLGLVSDADQLPRLVPNSVLIHNYVKFRMILRKLTSITEQKVAMETSFQDMTNQKQWNEIVEDLWSKALPHLRDKGFAFIDPTLLMNSTTGRYGFYGDEWEEETESELGGDLNKDTSEVYSEDGSLQPFSMDYDDPLLYGEASYYSTLPSVRPSISPSIRTSETTLVGESVRETLRQGLEDPEIREEMLKMISKKKVSQDIEQQAKDWSPQMISQFLEGLDKERHAKTFLDEDIDGVQLLNADRDVYQALGVTSNIEYAQIAVLFKRELLGVETIHCSVSELINSNKRLATHVKALEKAGIDVDMLKFAQQNDFLVDLLKDIGITKPLDRNRFDAALKNVEESVTSPDETLQHSDSDHGFVAYSTPV